MKKTILISAIALPLLSACGQGFDKEENVKAAEAMILKAANTNGGYCPEVKLFKESNRKLKGTVGCGTSGTALHECVVELDSDMKNMQAECELRGQRVIIR